MRVVTAASLLLLCVRGGELIGVYSGTARAPLRTATLNDVLRGLPAVRNDAARAAVAAGAAWRDYGMVFVADDHEQAAAMADWIACEHLEIHTDNDAWYLQRLRNYGSLFLGPDATVTYSDKGCTGTNHTLPTQAAARYTGGLSVAKFLKTLTWQRVTDPVAAQQIARDAAAFGEVDGLQAHAATAQIRLQRMTAG